LPDPSENHKQVCGIPVEDDKEIVRYIGKEIANPNYHHGGLRPVVGVHNIQVLRANRTFPLEVDDYGWTYNHAPMLAYWQGKFYLEYLSNPEACEQLLADQLVTLQCGRKTAIPMVIMP
jgi:hypothetical protein